MVDLGEDKILADKYIEQNVVPRIATEWYDVGLELGIKDYELDKIKLIVDPTGGKCTDMLKAWLKRSATGPENRCPTWRNMYDAMRALDLNKAAEDMKDDLLKGVPN